MIFLLLVIVDLLLAAATIPSLRQGHWSSIIAFGFIMASAGWCAALGVTSRN